MPRPATAAELSWLDELGDSASRDRVRGLSALEVLFLPVIGLCAVILFFFGAGLIGALVYGVVSNLRLPSLSSLSVATFEAEEAPALTIPPLYEIGGDINKRWTTETGPKSDALAVQAAVAERIRKTAAAEGSRKEEATRKISEAFVAIENKPARARAFLTRYKGNPDAEESGFVAAAWRIINERMIYSASNVTKCGDCWCLVEQPLLTADTSPTQ